MRSQVILETGRWMRAEGVGRRVGRREDLFDQVAKAVVDRVVLYLESGVYKGDATRYWSHGCAIPVVDSTALTPLRSYPKIGFSAGNETFFNSRCLARHVRSSCALLQGLVRSNLDVLRAAPARCAGRYLRRGPVFVHHLRPE